MNGSSTCIFISSFQCKYTKSPPFCDGQHMDLPLKIKQQQEQCDTKDTHDKCKLCTHCGHVPDF